MAKARTKGRPIAPLELSAEERTYLERQVRRHRVARSLSDRCRIILRCADYRRPFCAPLLAGSV
jgi:hypothetical protein